MPNQNQWCVFKRLLTYLKPYKFLTFLALTFLLSTTVIKSIIPLVASYFIDHFLSIHLMSSLLKPLFKTKKQGVFLKKHLVFCIFFRYCIMSYDVLPVFGVFVPYSFFCCAFACFIKII